MRISVEADSNMGQTRKPEAGDIYRHFKDKLYEIITVAIHSETEEEMVVYRQMYGNLETYVRPLSMFLSEVDCEKYPEVKQKYRFEKAEGKTPEPEYSEHMQKETAPADEPVTVPAAEPELDPAVLEYIEAESVDARINILASLHHRITDEMINTMAVVTDVEVNDGPVEQRYQELKNCLLMKQKFEKKRY